MFLRLLPNRPLPKTVGTIVRIKENALRGSIYKRWIEFVVFVALVGLQAYSLRDMVAFLQQPIRGNGSTAVGLFEWNVALIVVTSLFNLSYTIDEITDIFLWVPKSAKLLSNIWWEKMCPLFDLDSSIKSRSKSHLTRIRHQAKTALRDMEGGCCKRVKFTIYCIFSALVALFITPLFAFCYSVYNHLTKDVWNAVDIIYISLVWASLGFHIYILTLVANRSAEIDGTTAGAETAAASFTATAPPASLSTLSAFALNIAGWSIVFIGLRLLTYFRSTDTIGPIIAMIMAIIRDMLPFMTVLVLLMFFGALAMPLMMCVLDKVTINTPGPMAGGGFADPQRSFLTMFMWINGDGNVEAFEKNYSALAYFYIFLIISSIIMMNLLIAIMGDSFDRVREQQKVQSRIVRAQIIHGIECSMPSSDKDRPYWQCCLPKWLKPWCKDARELNPAAVLRVVKASGTFADDADDADDAEWGGRLAEVRKEIKEATKRAEDRAAKADASAASAANQMADLKREIAEVTKRADARAAKAEATMDSLVDAIRALSEGGGGRGVGNGAVEKKRCQNTAEMEVAV